MDKPIKFEAIVIETTEGYGVLHILAAGDWLPKQWIEDVWTEIHCASIIDVRLVRETKDDGSLWEGTRGLASYCLQKYLSNQNELVRHRTTKFWIFPKSARIWQLVWRIAGNKADAVDLWESVLFRCGDFREALQFLLRQVDGRLRLASRQESILARCGPGLDPWLTIKGQGTFIS